MTAKKPASAKGLKATDAEDGKLSAAPVAPNEPQPEKPEAVEKAEDKSADDPTGLTDAEINRLTSDGLKKPGTNKFDAATTMQRNRDITKGKDVPEPAYSAQNGGQGIG